MRTNLIYSMVVSVAALASCLALTACPGAAHDYYSGQVSPKSLKASVLGTWRTECLADTGSTSKQAELNFGSGGQVVGRDLYFTDSLCQSPDLTKTDDANKGVPASNYTTEGRGQRARGKLTMDRTVNGRTHSDAFLVAVITTSHGQQLVLKSTDNPADQELIYNKVQ